MISDDAVPTYVRPDNDGWHHGLNWLELCLEKSLDTGYQDDKSLKPEDVPAEEGWRSGTIFARQIPLAAEPLTNGGQELRASLIDELASRAFVEFWLAQMCTSNPSVADRKS